MKTSEVELDGFIEELNSDIARVGEISTLKAFKLHQFVSFSMVWITILGIVFIIENQVTNMELPQYEGINIIYYVAIVLALVIGYFGSNFSEAGKIEFIKGSIFSYGSNRMWQMLGVIGVIALLIYINKTGVQDMANYGLRYMNEKIMEDEGIQLDIGIKTQRESLVKQNNKLILDLQMQKEDIKKATEDYVSKVDQRAYRTMISTKREKARAEMAKIDWKIQQIQVSSSKSIDSVQENVTKLKSKIDAKKLENAEFIEGMKNIGLYIAVWGEVIDAFFIMLYLLLHKTNPNIEGSPSIERNRKMFNAAKSIVKGKSEGSLKTPVKNSTNFYLKQQKKIVKIKDEDIEEIVNNLIDENDTLSHDGIELVLQPRQRNVMRAFYNQNNRVLRPERLTKYNRKKVKEGVLKKLGKQYVFLKERELVA